MDPSVTSCLRDAIQGWLRDLPFTKQTICKSWAFKSPTAQLKSQLEDIIIKSLTVFHQQWVMSVHENKNQKKIFYFSILTSILKSWTDISLILNSVPLEQNIFYIVQNKILAINKSSIYNIYKSWLLLTRFFSFYIKWLNFEIA